MNENPFGGIDEILRYLGYEKADNNSNSNNDSGNQSSCSSQCCNEKINDDGTIEHICEKYGIKYKATIDPTGGARGNCCIDFNSDIIGGFQDMNPQLFIVLGEVIGDLLAGQLPFNVANAVSNWFNLVGQIIETYASQIVYFQAGPGRHYNPEDRNVVNPFCSSSRVTEESQENSSDNNSSSSCNANNNDDSTNSNKSTDNNESSNMDNEAKCRENNSRNEDLRMTVERIDCEIEEMKNQFDILNDKIEILKKNLESLKREK